MLPSKWENLSRFSTKLIYVCKKLPLALDWRQSNILSKYLIHIFFNFAIPFLCYFQRLQLLVLQKFWTNFCCIVLLCMTSKSASEIFKILFQTRDINIFVLSSVFFGRYVLLKSSFSDEKKHQRWNLRYNLLEQLSEIDVTKY